MKRKRSDEDKKLKDAARKRKERAFSAMAPAVQEVEATMRTAKLALGAKPAQEAMGSLQQAIAKLEVALQALEIKYRKMEDESKMYVVYYTQTQSLT